MQILQHFNQSSSPPFIIYRFKITEWNQFLSKLTKDFRLCYISDSKLQSRAIKIGISQSKFLEQYVIPDDPIIKSGDFGEMLCYFTVMEHFKNKGFLLRAPRKWRWKESRNSPSPGVDAVMFYRANNSSYSTSDFLVTVESKMKSVRSKRHRIQEAINGAQKDKLTRLTNTLNWLEEKYAKQGNKKMREYAERFKDPATYGTYRKVHKAIAILDSALEKSEIVKAVTNPHGFTLIIFSIKDLRKAYEDTRMNIITSV